MEEGASKEHSQSGGGAEQSHTTHSTSPLHILVPPPPPHPHTSTHTHQATERVSPPPTTTRLVSTRGTRVSGWVYPLVWLHCLASFKMRAVCVAVAVIVVVVVVSAAPPSPLRTPTSSSSSPASPHSPPGSPLARSKRGNTPPKSATIPYSNYRRVTGIHRYRYPLYRKRNYPVHYDYDDDVFLPEEDEEEGEEGMLDYPMYSPRPSLFRERNNREHQLEEEEIAMAALAEAEREEQERREKELMLENAGYFHELPEPDLSDAAQVPVDDSYYVPSPYMMSYPDLQKLNRMYELEKQDAMDSAAQDNLLSLYGVPQGDIPLLHQSGRKTMAPTATGRFYDALSYVRKRATELKPSYSEGDLSPDAASPPRAKKQQQYLTSAAGRYWRVRDEQQQQEEQQKATSSTSAVRDPEMMIRRRKKRNTTTTTATTTASTTPAAAKRRKTINPTTITTKTPKHTPATTTTTTTTTTIQPRHHTPTTALTTTASSSTTAPHRDHRNKRAFSDYFKWEKRSEEEEEEEEEEEDEEDDKVIDDFLTREYFKTIARSVGQKRKRMAYGQFEPDVEEDKRSSMLTLEDILNNPETLRFVENKLQEAEMVMQEAGAGLSQYPRGGTRDEAAHKLLNNLIVRMDAIEHMREALRQLQELQESRTGKRVGGRREVQVREEERKRSVAEEENWRKSMEAGGGGRSQKRSVRRRLRRDDIADLFLGNEREECPVLWWILESCSAVSDKVGDEGQVFLPACIKHEICYVCGASQGISGHECDAVLSSALEASCPARSLDCLAAAGSTFSTLSRPSGYDPAGSCANDPCVIHFLESR